jgi:hypothetical protein
VSAYLMSRSEFVERANHGQVVTADVHWNPSVTRDVLDLSARVSGYWTHLAPRGARSCQARGLPVHGPAVCARGSYAC